MDTPRSASQRMEARSATGQAAEWLMILESEGDRANPAFAEWLRGSPTRVQAYLRAATLDTMLRRIDPERSIEIVRPDPATAAPDIGPDPGDGLFGERSADRHSLRLRNRRTWRLAAAVAGLGLALGWALTEKGLPGRATYRTDVGEQRTVQLQDGSTLTLNTDSRADVRFTAEERQVQPKLKANVAKITSWRQRRLAFVDEPLSLIGEELNRYNRARKIRVEGSAARQLKYAVVLDADDPESLIAVLAGDPRVTVERTGHEIVVRAR